MGAYVISVLNHKGGVGKTTVVLNIAAALAGRGKRVLVIDLDKQANATDRLLGSFKRSRPHLYDLLLDEEGALDAGDGLYPARAPFSTIRVLAGDARLGAAERDLSPADRPDVWSALKDKVSPLADEFDFILIDNPPSLNVLTAAGLVLAAGNGGFLIPLDLGSDSTKGAKAVVEAVGKLHKARVLEECPDFLGLVFALYQKAKAKGTKQVEVNARIAFSGKLAPIHVPHSSYVTEAAAAGKTVIETHPKSPVAAAYIALAEILTGEKLAVEKQAKRAALKVGSTARHKLKAPLKAKRPLKTRTREIRA